MVRYRPPEDWQQWVEWLSAGLHGRNRWRLSLLVMGLVFGRGRRTVTAWLRAVGIRHDFSDYYYGSSAESVGGIRRQSRGDSRPPDPLGFVAFVPIPKGGPRAETPGMPGVSFGLGH
jgi:hypothetical protein